jgi:cardiolipin synthase
MILVWIAVAFEVVGIVLAISALYTVRTPQGTVAWVTALLALPALAIPAYLLFGRRRFHGYVIARRRQLHAMADDARAVAERYRARGLLDAPRSSDDRALTALARLPFTLGNEVELLVDGEATFRALFDGVARARRDLLVQFYIFTDDALGRELRDRLLERAAAGVRVRVLYDEIGSPGVRSGRRAPLVAAGADVRAFHTRRGPKNRFQLNFRNHRKLVVVDGVEAFAGGLNVGDEYVGRNRRFGPWRDTHVRVRGPVVATLQLAFVEDWHWASGTRLELPWDPPPAAESGMRALALPTGPADEGETGSLLVTTLCHLATERLWLASPYFVPDSAVLSALTLAALRGVDVRVLLPEAADHRLVWLARFAYVPDLERAGVRFFEYVKGFLHEKVIVVDDHLATIGTMNLDNRSLRLNFELTLLFDDVRFAGEVAAMLARDLDGARPLTAASIAARGRIFGLGVRIANLFAPIL